MKKKLYTVTYYAGWNESKIYGVFDDYDLARECYLKAFEADKNNIINYLEDYGDIDEFENVKASNEYKAIDEDDLMFTVELQEHITNMSLMD